MKHERCEQLGTEMLFPKKKLCTYMPSARNETLKLEIFATIIMVA